MMTTKEKTSPAGTTASTVNETATPDLRTAEKKLELKSTLHASGNQVSDEGELAPE